MGCNNSAPVATNPKPDAENANNGEQQQQNTAGADSGKKELAANWAAVSGKLPRGRSAEEVEARAKLFASWDPNGNKMLSLAEITTGCIGLGLDKLTPNLSPILLRAYTKAKDVGTKEGDKNDNADFVNAKEFRLLLVYIYDYFELNVAFNEIDSSNDRRVTLEEFKKAVPRLQEWGVPVADAEAEFKLIDKNGGGVVLFDEFCEWAIAKHLDVDGKENIA